jgi:hypothetical protein
LEEEELVLLLSFLDLEVAPSSLEGEGEEEEQ